MNKFKKNKYIWLNKSHEVISCDEKLKILNENILELENNFQNIFDDAVIMGCDEKDFKKKVVDIVNNLKFSFDK